MPTKNKPLIGILGGMGPQAGLDLASKITSETRGDSDQDNVPVVVFSIPDNIPDRTEYLMGRSDADPSGEIARQLGIMARLGVTNAAIACNTAHADPIFQTVSRILDEEGTTLTIHHLVDETIRFIRSEHPDISKVGILGTDGTYRLELYAKPLSEGGLVPVIPDPEVREKDVHDAIYNPATGIKAHSDPVTETARAQLLSAIEHLRIKGAELIILGCTELPLAIPEPSIGDMILVDPARIVARSLILATYPDRLHTCD